MIKDNKAGASTGAKSDPEQTQRFVDMAREMGGNEDEAAFKAKLAAIARQKPKAVSPPAKVDKGKR